MKKATIDPTGGEVYMYKKGKQYIVTIKNNKTGYTAFTIKTKTKKMADKKFNRLIKISNEI